MAFAATVDAFHKGGPSAFAQTLHPDVRLRTVDDFPGGGEFEGREAAIAFVNEFAEVWGSARYEYEDARIINGCIVHRARWVVAGKTSGIETSLEFFGSARMEGPLLAELMLFYDEEETLAYARGS